MRHFVRLCCSQHVLFVVRLLLSSCFSAGSVDCAWICCRAGVERSTVAVLLLMHSAVVWAVGCTARLDDCINGGERSWRRHFYGWPTINSGYKEAHCKRTHTYNTKIHSDTLKRRCVLEFSHMQFL